MTGRKRTISAKVREAIAAAGVDGLTPEELRVRIPGLGHRQGKHAVDRLVDAGEIHRLGNYRRTKFFDASISASDAKTAMVRFLVSVAVRAKELEAQAHQRRLAKARALRAEALAAMADARAAMAAERARATAERERLRLEARNAKAREKTKAKRRHHDNALADRIRGTGTLKAQPKVTATITKHADFRETVHSRPRGRFEVDPSALTGLSKLPLGVYAEPASRWASSATDRRAA